MDDEKQHETVSDGADGGGGQPQVVLPEEVWVRGKAYQIVDGPVPERKRKPRVRLPGVVRCDVVTGKGGRDKQCRNPARNDSYPPLCHMHARMGMGERLMADGLSPEERRCTALKKTGHRCRGRIWKEAGRPVCSVHAGKARMDLSKRPRCGATRADGEPCQAAAMVGGSRGGEPGGEPGDPPLCPTHAGLGGFQPGNFANWKHGLHSRRVFRSEWVDAKMWSFHVKNGEIDLRELMVVLRLFQLAQFRQVMGKRDADVGLLTAALRLHMRLTKALEKLAEANETVLYHHGLLQTTRELEALMGMPRKLYYLGLLSGMMGKRVVATADWELMFTFEADTPWAELPRYVDRETGAFVDGPVEWDEAWEVELERKLDELAGKGGND